MNGIYTPARIDSALVPERLIAGWYPLTKRSVPILRASSHLTNWQKFRTKLSLMCRVLTVRTLLSKRLARERTRY